MLKLHDNLAFAKGLKGRVLDCATLLQEQTPREWLCHSGDHMILVRWQQGILGLGVGESEFETYSNVQICAMDYDLIKQQDVLITFEIIKEFMDWTLDDCVCLE